MSSEGRDPDTGTPPVANGVAATPAALRQQPGLVVGLCSIAAGLVGYGVPVLGTLVSCVGIGLGIWGFRQGRAAHYAAGIVCGVIGTATSVLGIVFWVCAILFESYR
jgi:hypothetical protein